MKQPARILLVEDNEADAFLFSETLAEAGPAGCSIETVSTLQAALARIGSGGLDVVVSDLGLPDSSGLDTIRRLEAADRDVAIVALTVREDDETALAALREGAQDYLVKGTVDRDLVWRSLRYAIERKRSEVSLRESEWRYRNLFQSIRDALVFTDMEGRITEANEAFLTMLGFTREELVGRNFREITPEAALSKEMREHEAMILGRGYSDIYEKEYARKDGSLCPVELR
ncbi:MAG: PAS domain S-box protein, partial [Spirochaetota bacterium]